MSKHWGNPAPMKCVPHQRRDCWICTEAGAEKLMSRAKHWMSNFCWLVLGATLAAIWLKR
jgi:hypothetical protein